MYSANILDFRHFDGSIKRALKSGIKNKLVIEGPPLPSISVDSVPIEDPPSGNSLTIILPVEIPKNIPILPVRVDNELSNGTIRPQLLPIASTQKPSTPQSFLGKRSLSPDRTPQAFIPALNPAAASRRLLAAPESTPRLSLNQETSAHKPDSDISNSIPVASPAKISAEFKTIASHHDPAPASDPHPPPSQPQPLPQPHPNHSIDPTALPSTPTINPLLFAQIQRDSQALQEQEILYNREYRIKTEIWKKYMVKRDPSRVSFVMHTAALIAEK
jgi:hypothetical protein